jgi:preprotein translocase subunit SecB
LAVDHIDDRPVTAIDALVVRGSFPPLMLAPVNFDALYVQAMRQQQEQQAAQTPAAH